MPLHGVVVYEILPDSCLNGVYANDWANNAEGRNELYNEIARKKVGEDKTSIPGRYDCFYFDLLNEECPCDLTIDVHPNRGHFRFQWFEKGTTNRIFEGSGWLTRNNQITVSYRSS